MGILGGTLRAAQMTSAQEQADQIISNRIANFRELGTASKNIGDELKLQQPNVPLIQQSAQLIKTRGKDMLHWFPPGSEPAPQVSRSWLDAILSWFSSDDSLALTTDAESHAKLVVWTHRPQFEQTHAKFLTEADKLSQVAQGGQVPAISAQFCKLARTCNSCHDQYREEKD